jgi:hypothetical protein
MPIFGVKENGQEVFFRIKHKRVNLPPYGVLDAEEVAKRPDVCLQLIKIKSLALESATKAEYDDYIKPVNEVKPLKKSVKSKK